MRKILLSAVMLALFASATVPVNAAPAKASLITPVPITQVSMPGRVNLNTADAETLKKELSGVGLTKAHAIVKHRETNGPFDSVEELLEVTGIGKALLDRNRDKLIVN